MIETTEYLARLGLRLGDQMFEEREMQALIRRWVVNRLDGSERQLWPPSPEDNPSEQVE